MGTPYPGFDPFTPSAQPASFGRFISGLSADDGDFDDAQVLMALAMACMDNTQFLAWRTIDIVSGGSYAFTTGITIRNTFNFAGVFSTTTFSNLGVNFDTAMRLYGGNTFYVGDNALGIGHVIIDGSGAGSGSSLQVSGAADAVVTDAGTLLRVESSAELVIGNAGLMRNLHYIAHSAAPCAVAAPRLYANNITKGVCTFQTTNAGAFILDDGMNYTLSFNGTNVRVTFATAMAGAVYCLTCNACDPATGSAYTIGASNRTANHFDLLVQTTGAIPSNVNCTTTAVQFDILINGTI